MKTTLGAQDPSGPMADFSTQDQCRVKLRTLEAVTFFPDQQYRPNTIFVTRLTTLRSDITCIYLALFPHFPNTTKKKHYDVFAILACYAALIGTYRRFDTAYR
jgi:hypothetical protein